MKTFYALIYCFMIAVVEKNSAYFEKCFFKNDTCGWTVHESVVMPGNYILVCGVGGSLDSCYPRYLFQDGDLWTRRTIRSIILAELPWSISDQVDKLDNRYVLATNSFSKDVIGQYNFYVSDIISPKIPMSLEFRCLHYSHLVLGDNALVVAYITDYFEPYEISHYLKTHGESSFINFSRTSVTLPIGTDFKLVFRAIQENWRGLILIDYISITGGLCEVCAENEFGCDDFRDECIPLSKVCDLNADCLGGEDEKNCDSEAVETVCKENMRTSRNKNRTLDEGSASNDVDFNLSVSDSNDCKTRDCCPFCATNDSEYSCPTNCTSSGLSFNCTSDNTPAYATSVTVSGLVQDALVFNDSFSNLRQIIIIHCKLQLLKIDSNLTIQTITISNSTIDIAEVDDSTSSLRFVRIENSTFDEVKFSSESGLKFNFFVHRSTLKNPTHISFVTGGFVDLSETTGFPLTIPNYIYDINVKPTIVNLSSCNLNEQPIFRMSVMVLDLSRNNLSTWFYSSLFQSLHLQHNSIIEINFTSDLRQSEAQLHFLDLSYNMIKVIREHDFVDLPNLLQLIMRNNRLEDIHENAFSFITKLHGLDLSSNNLHSLKRNHFLRLLNLQSLDLRNNKIQLVEGMFDGLISIKYLRVDSYTLCCAQPKTVSKIQCTAPVDEFSSCNNLIGIPLLISLIWYIALFAVFGNLLSPFYRGFLLKVQNLSSFVIYSINLGIADFLMGVYLYIIAGANLRFSGRYGFEDEGWRHSHICTVAGVLATLSSEASALFVLLITIDRIIIIRSQFTYSQRRSFVSKVTSAFVWILSLILSLLPLLESDYFENYYSSSGVCISLPLSVQRKSGWEYYMALFVGTKSVIFLAVLLGQLVIVVYVLHTRKDVYLRYTIQQREEVTLTKTMVAVAITDVLCWLPIGVIGFLTFRGIDVGSQEYAWFVVVLLPVRSALNPLIYMLSETLKWITRKPQMPKVSHSSQSSRSSENTRPGGFDKRNGSTNKLKAA
ncbi:G-protein coupled receptor GRL101 [Magallana gigas]|uniref:G-protein coupled receptor GRL101 n=1 Tax=Magallana gigas TaxID=29159 RepID=UPI0033426D92